MAIWDKQPPRNSKKKYPGLKALSNNPLKKLLSATSNHFSTGGSLLSCDIGEHHQTFLCSKHVLLCTRTDICPESHKRPSRRKDRERCIVGHNICRAMCHPHNRNLDQRIDLDPNAGKQESIHNDERSTRRDEEKLSLRRPQPPAFFKLTSPSQPDLHPAGPHSSAQPPPHPRHLCLLPSFGPPRVDCKAPSPSSHASCTKLSVSQRPIGVFSSSANPTLPSPSHHSWLDKTGIEARKRD